MLLGRGAPQYKGNEIKNQNQINFIRLLNYCFVCFILGWVRAFSNHFVYIFLFDANLNAFFFSFFFTFCKLLFSDFDATNFR